MAVSHGTKAADSKVNESGKSYMSDVRSSEAEQILADHKIVNDVVVHDSQSYFERSQSHSYASEGNGRSVGNQRDFTTPENQYYDDYGTSNHEEVINGVENEDYQDDDTENYGS